MDTEIFETFEVIRKRIRAIERRLDKGNDTRSRTNRATSKSNAEPPIEDLIAEHVRLVWEASNRPMSLSKLSAIFGKRLKTAGPSLMQVILAKNSGLESFEIGIGTWVAPAKLPTHKRHALRDATHIKDKALTDTLDGLFDETEAKALAAMEAEVNALMADGDAQLPTAQPLPPIESLPTFNRDLAPGEPDYSQPPIEAPTEFHLGKK